MNLPMIIDCEYETIDDSRQDRIEREFRAHMARQNQSRQARAEYEAREASRMTKNAMRMKKQRRMKIQSQAVKSLYAIILMWGLFHAQTAGLISTVLTVPVYCLGFAFIGGCISNIIRLWKIDRWEERRGLK